MIISPSRGEGAFKKARSWVQSFTYYLSLPFLLYTCIHPTHIIYMNSLAVILSAIRPKNKPSISLLETNPLAKIIKQLAMFHSEYAFLISFVVACGSRTSIPTQSIGSPATLVP
jgi:hypothetical protein